MQRDRRLLLQLLGLDAVAEEGALLGPPGDVEPEGGTEVVDDWVGVSNGWPEDMMEATLPVGMISASFSLRLSSASIAPES